MAPQVLALMEETVRQEGAGPAGGLGCRTGPCAPKLGLSPRSVCIPPQASQPPSASPAFIIVTETVVESATSKGVFLPIFPWVRGREGT